MSIDYNHKNNEEGGDPPIPTILTWAAIVNNRNIPLRQVIQCEDLPLVAVQVKKATLEGAFTFQILFQGKE